MARLHSPSIVTNGLVFFVDAANPRSYVGTGSTWNDMSLNRQAVTLFNTASFSSSNKGSIIFNGTTNYANGNATLTARSIIAYVNINTLHNGIVYGPTSNGSDNWLRVDNVGRLSLRAAEAADTNEFDINSTQTFSLNTWYQIGGTIDTNVTSIYINGQLQVASTPRVFTIGTWQSIPYIGRRGTIAQQTFSGAVASLQVYDRVLSTIEIKNNFDTFRSRFGI